MKQLIIFRGPSGSGKTTAAKGYVAKHGGEFFEADAFFHQNGQYSFDASKLGQAHGSCQRRVRDAMQKASGPVVVSNTSMTLWELNPYLQMAKEYGYDVTVYRIKGPWDAEVFAKRNVHGVPVAGVQKQINKYEELESEKEYDG